MVLTNSASVALDIVSDKKAQKVLTGVTKDDEVVVKITNKFSGDVAHMLNINKEEAKT